MNNGIMFGTGGPMMSGTWYNPATGDSFTVRDSFFENNQYVVSTTDGRVLSYDMIQHYVQSDKPIEMPKKQQQDTLPDEVASLIADDVMVEVEDDGLFVDTDIYGVPSPTPVSLGNLNAPKSAPSITTNEGIIAKALGKSSKPEVVADVKWVDFPKKQIEMLSEIMEIDTKEIVEWYTSQLNTIDIAIAIHNSIVSYINEQLYGKVEDKSGVVEVNDVEAPTYTQTSVVIEDTPKTPKKATPKKTTKKTKK
jgi:hypothetical protein